MNNLQYAQAIDARRRKIENKFAPKIKNVLHNLNQDAYDLFLSTGNYNSQELAENYTPEFISIIREIMRFTAKEFGFDMRKYRIKNIQKSFYVKADNLDILLTDEELREVNRQFAREMLIFVANESEKQALYIQNTNFKQLDEAKQKAILRTAQKIQNLEEMILNIDFKINDLIVREFINNESNELIDILEERKAKLQRFLDELQNNQREVIAKEIKDDLVSKEEGRASLIASQVSGMTEGNARESELLKLAIIAENQGIALQKEWIGILDDRIRQTHRLASGQKVLINEKFNVGGFPCSYPRDPSLPISETANCRCVYRVLRSQS